MQEKQNLTLENRKFLEVTGVIDVESSNDTIVKVNTKLGKLHIFGEDLSIEKINIDTGDFSLKGLVKKIEYKSSINNNKLSSLFK